MPAEAGIQPNCWIPAPRLREDKLRGNDTLGVSDHQQNSLL